MQLTPILAGAAVLAQVASSKITWNGPCIPAPELSNLTAICGSLKVPLDYVDRGSNQTLSLEIAKLPATKQPKKESVLVNFGGPGIVSLDKSELYTSGLQMHRSLGGQHDVVTFNPRGTGNTLPFSCGKGADSLMSPGLSTSSDVALGQIWANGAAHSDLCYSQNNKTGGLIGTAFVARDMMQIVDALGENGLLNYWGQSYGTTLGAVAAGMFPDRMGRVVLDGVVNSHEYFHGFDTHMARDGDKTFSGFCSSCLETPNLCPLAKRYKSAVELENAIYSQLESLKYNPIYVSGAIYTYDMVKQYIEFSLKGTQLWQAQSQVLDNLMTRNMPALANLAKYLTSPAYGSSTSDSLLGIRCSDKMVRTSKLEQLLPYLSSSWSISKINGDLNDNIEATCAQWKMSAKEHYTGDFHVKTLHPVLLVSNMFDPVTPLSSAHNMSAGLEGSVVLQQNGYGHTSEGQPSSCTAKVINAYFANGSLPSKGTVCQPDLPPFYNS